MGERRGVGGRAHPPPLPADDPPLLSLSLSLSLSTHTLTQRHRLPVLVHGVGPRADGVHARHAAPLRQAEGPFSAVHLHPAVEDAAQAERVLGHAVEGGDGLVGDVAHAAGRGVGDVVDLSLWACVCVCLDGMERRGWLGREGARKLCVPAGALSLSLSLSLALSQHTHMQDHARPA